VFGWDRGDGEPLGDERMGGALALAWTDRIGEPGGEKCGPPKKKGKEKDDGAFMSLRSGDYCAEGRRGEEKGIGTRSIRKFSCPPAGGRGEKGKGKKKKKRKTIGGRGGGGKKGGAYFFIHIRTGRGE